MDTTKIINGLSYFLKRIGNALSKILKKGDYQSGYWDGIRAGIIIGFLAGIAL